jgi:replication factor A1
MEGNYEKILKKIATSSGLEKEEIERRVEAKRAKLSGLISLDGAAQIVAAELGISFDNEILKLEELLPGMRKVHVIGKILSISPVRNFTTKKGDQGKVCNFVIADDTSNLKVVLWDTNHIDLIERGEIKAGSVVEIAGGSMRENEIHLGSFSELKLTHKEFDKLIVDKVVKEKEIINFVVGDNSKVRAFIVSSFEPKFFYVCPECKKKANPEGEGFVCVEHGKVVPEKRALMNLILDDGTETIRAVFFHDKLLDLGINDLDNIERLLTQREDILGKEMIFSGSVRMNKFFNNPEFIVDEVKEIDLDSLIEILDK